MFKLPVLRQATLPAGRASADHSIASMDEGESGWTVPWAMYADKSRALWLNGGYTIDSRPGGTVQMRVWRDAEGWHVDASRCRDHEWSGGLYVGTFTPIAVVTAAF